MKKKISIISILFVSVLILLMVSCPSVFEFDRKAKALNGIAAKISEYANTIEGAQVSYIIKDLRFSNLQLVSNSDEPFKAASVIKIPMLAVALNAVAGGKISLDEEIKIDIGDYIGGSGVLKKEKFPMERTFEELLRLMIVNSDNVASNKIIEVLGFEYMNAGFKKFGLTDTVLKRKMMDFVKRKQGFENYTSSTDLVKILEQIYHNKLINKNFSRLALSFLKSQKVNDRIPRYLPEDVEVAHKTGLERSVVHDAGIVFTQGGDYVIVVLIQGHEDNRAAKKVIANLSLLTYNLYQQ